MPINIWDEYEPRYHPDSCSKTGSLLCVTCILRLELLKLYGAIPCLPNLRQPFPQAAPVGISGYYLNLRKLSAGDFLSLQEYNILLTPSQPFSIFMELFGSCKISYSSLMNFPKLVKPSKQKFIYRPEITVNMRSN